MASMLAGWKSERRVSLVNRVVLLTLLAGLATSGSCRDLFAQLGRQERIEEYIYDRTREHVYQMPIAQVWPEVRLCLFQQGFQVVDSDVSGSFAVETAPRPVAVDKTERFLILGTKLDEGSCRIECTKMTTDPFSSHSARDVEFEWTLLQRVDPQSAQRIRTEAEAAADR